MISVVYRFFRPESYFHARDNRLTVTSSSCQTFSKHLFWTGSDASGLISWKLPSDICCLSFVSSSMILFSRERRETIGWLWHHRRVKLFQNFILDRQWCKGSYKLKITEWYLLFIVFFVQNPIFTRETIGWLWRHRRFKLFQNIYFGQAVMQGVL